MGRDAARVETGLVPHEKKVVQKSAALRNTLGADSERNVRSGHEVVGNAEAIEKVVHRRSAFFGCEFSTACAVKTNWTAIHLARLLGREFFRP